MLDDRAGAGAVEERLRALLDRAPLSGSRAAVVRFAHSVFPAAYEFQIVDQFRFLRPASDYARRTLLHGHAFRFRRAAEVMYPAMSMSCS